MLSNLCRVSRYLEVLKNIRFKVPMHRNFNDFNKSSSIKFNISGTRFSATLHKQDNNERKENTDGNKNYEKIRNFGLYVLSFIILFFGLSNIFVPFYRRFCQFQNLPGYSNKVLSMIGIVPNPDRKITVRFHGHVAREMEWDFYPEKATMEVVLGEPALAFFKAKNNSDKPIVGVSTYSIIPISASPYFYKIQCFCFEEQRLDPGDEVLMPVFFYIDPKFDEVYENLLAREVILTYNFYKSQNNDYINEKIENSLKQQTNPI